VLAFKICRIAKPSANISQACIDARTTSVTQWSLIGSPRACSVQAGDSHVSVTERHCAMQSADLRWLSDMPSKRRLRSSPTAFSAAGGRLWNSLSTDIVACDTFPQFRQKNFS